jgi:hypothetical protein
MKKLPLMAAVLAVALWQAPAAVAVLHPGTHHLLWVSLYGVEVSDGMASAAASYRCNAGYADAQYRSYVFVAENTFPFDAICDGNTHLIKRKAPLPVGVQNSDGVRVQVSDPLMRPSRSTH